MLYPSSRRQGARTLARGLLVVCTVDILCAHARYGGKRMLDVDLRKHTVKKVQGNSLLLTVRDHPKTIWGQNLGSPHQ